MKDSVHALIDFGSNTVNLAVYAIRGNTLEYVHKEKEYLGLVSYMQNNALTQTGIKKSIDVLNAMKHTAASFTSNIYCFATASLRDIVNSDEAEEQIRKETNLPLEIISAKKEAYYDYLGAIHALPLTDAVVADVGGGSTQIIRVIKGEFMHSVSLPAGALKLYAHFVHHQIPNTEEISQIETYLQGELLEAGLSDGEKYGVLCTIGGTAKAMAKLHKNIFNRTDDLLNYEYDAAELEKLVQYAVAPKNYYYLLNLLPKRAHTMLPGLLLFKMIADKAGIKKIILSPNGVREGYMYENILRRGEI